MIGNDYNKDIEGALSIGMKAIHFNETQSIVNNSKADYTVFKLKEIISILNS